jgi:hypothetical protein
MPNYNNIPILRDAQLMMVEVERIVKDFLRYHKYTLGLELRKKVMQVYKLFRVLYSISKTATMDRKFGLCCGRF